MMETNVITKLDALTYLQSLPDNSVHCIITSPPYYGLRNYGTDGQIGLEPTLHEFIDTLVVLFREARRVLHPMGTMWVNMGSSYSASTIFSQHYIIREDLTDEEKSYVIMEMFGVWIEGNQEAGKGAMPKMLHTKIPRSQNRRRSYMESKTVKEGLRKTQTRKTSPIEGTTPPIKMGNNQATRQRVCLLRRRKARISNYRPHKRRRSETPSRINREFKGQLSSNISGYTSAGVSARQIQSSLLQLQLFNRCLGILSTHTFSKDEIPHQVRFAFTRPIAYKAKDLIQQPHLLAECLRLDGWYLRSEIIFSKPNPMPSSAKDRPTVAHETVFLFAKSARYWYDGDAIREPSNMEDEGKKFGAGQTGTSKGMGYSWQGITTRQYNPAGRNRRTVWTIPTQPSKFDHFAAFPEKLIEPMILAGCPPKVCVECGTGWRRVVERSGGTIGKDWVQGGKNRMTQGMSQESRIQFSTKGYNVKTLGWQPSCNCDTDTEPGITLDFFMGSGTTALVAQKNNRRWLGCEINEDYIEIANTRLQGREKEYHDANDGKPTTLPMFDNDSTEG